jgi:hypothetical protein
MLSQSRKLQFDYPRREESEYLAVTLLRLKKFIRATIRKYQYWMTCSGMLFIPEIHGKKSLISVYTRFRIAIS